MDHTSLSYTRKCITSPKDGAPSVCIDYAADGTKLGERRASVKLKAAGATAIAPPVVVPEKQYFGAGYVNTGGITTLYTTYGYFTSDGTFHAYIPDSRGNVAAVVNASTGAVEQQNSYYPYGATTSQSTGADVNPLKFGGKELTTLFGRHEYDFSARMYAPLSARFSSPDRKAWDYPWLSPYCFCAADPINYVDPTGEDIVVLYYDEDLGHLAMLIQNEDGKWQYYSVNGNNVYVSGHHIGGRTFNDVAVGSWDTPQEFLNSTYNVRDDESKDDKSKNHFGYEIGYQISTSSEQDAVMRNSFSKIANTEYDITDNNCATAVQKTMIDAGIPVSPFYSVEASYIPMATPFGLVDVYNGTKINSWYTFTSPHSTILSIVLTNPNGTVIKK